MKTTIIQLETHDDIISARDKMGWAKGGRILLVWPERGVLLNRRLDLALLQRHSASLGAQLALVSHDPDVRYYAPRLGIPVFKSLRKAEKEPWRVPRQFRGAAADGIPSARGRPAETSPGSLPEPEPPAALSEPEHIADAEQLAPGIDSTAVESADLATPADAPQTAADAGPPAAVEPPAGRKLPARPEINGPVLTPLARLIYFGLGVLAVLAIAAVLTPTATIVLTPQTQVQAVVMDVWTGEDVAAMQLSGAAPSRWMHVTVEGRDVEPAGGTMDIAERTAAGMVQFTNLTDQPVDIPAGLVSRTPGDEPVRFGVTRAGRLTAGPGATLDLPVQALDPGESGNLPANSLTAIEGPLGTQVSATNPSATTGGLSRQNPAPSPADRRRLHARLSQSLLETAREELQRQLGPDDMIIDASLAPVETIEEDFDPDEGLPADQVALSLRIEYAALVVSGEDLRLLAQAIFDANLQPGFTPVSGSLQIEAVNAPQRADPSQVDDKPVYRWQIHANRRVMAQIDGNLVTRLVLGRTAGSALPRLQASLPLEGPPELRMQPAWWPRLPVLPFRVNVVALPGG